MKIKFIPAAAIFLVFGLANLSAPIHAQAPAGAGTRPKRRRPENPRPNSNSAAPGKTHAKTQFYIRATNGENQV